jgi:outer membrane protein
MKLRTLALLIASTLAAASQTVQAENLLQVYQQAKEYDAQFKAQEAAHLATLEKKQQALASLKPQLNASGSVDDSMSKTWDPVNASSNALTLGYNVQATKSIYNKQLDASISQIDALIAQSQVDLEAKRQDLMMRVVQAYFNVLIAQDNVSFAQTEKAAIGRQLEQAQAFFDAGRSAITDVKESEASYASAQSQELTALQQLDIAREALRVVTGGFYNSLNAPNANTPMTMPSPNDINSWVTIAQQTSYQLKAGQQGLLAAQRNIDVQRAGKKPTVGVYAGHSGSRGDSSISSSDYTRAGLSIGVQANINLYDGGKIDSQVREAQNNFRAAQQNYILQDRQIEQQVRSAFLTMQSSIGQIEANRQALAAAETAAEASRAGFEVGTRTAVDVLNSLRLVFSARRNYASSRYNLLLNSFTLRQAAGTLNERDILALNGYMNQAPRLNASSDVAANTQVAPNYRPKANARVAPKGKKPVEIANSAALNKPTSLEEQLPAEEVVLTEKETEVTVTPQADGETDIKKVTTTKTRTVTPAVPATMADGTEINTDIINPAPPSGDLGEGFNYYAIPAK